MIKQGSSKHMKINKIIFTDGDEVFVYPLDKDGKHITKMGRAKRTNYKKNAQPSSNKKETMKTSTSSSEFQVDCQVKSPEIVILHQNEFFENIKTIPNLDIFDSPVNNFEIINLNLSQDSNNFDNDSFLNPLLPSGFQVLNNEQSLVEIPPLEFDSIEPPYH